MHGAAGAGGGRPGGGRGAGGRGGRRRVSAVASGRAGACWVGTSAHAAAGGGAAQQH